MLHYIGYISYTVQVLLQLMNLVACQNRCQQHLLYKEQQGGT